MKKLRPFVVQIASKSGEHIGDIHVTAEDVKLLFDVLGIENINRRQNGLWNACFLLWLSYMIHLLTYHDMAGDLKDGYDYICSKLYKALERKEKKNV